VFLIAGCLALSSLGLAQSNPAPAKQLAHGAGQSVKPLVDVPFEVGKVDENGRVILAAPIGTQTTIADIEKISPRAAAEKALAESHKAPPIVKPSPTSLGPEKGPLLLSGNGKAPRIEMETKTQVPVTGISFVAIPPPGPPPPPGVVYVGPVPPDVTMGAGPNQLVVGSNLVIATFDKLGNLLGSSGLNGPGFFKQLAGQFGNFAVPWQVFDPVVHYDEHLKRFWVTAGAVNNSTSQSLVLIALSKSSDATSGWSMASVDMTLDGSSQSGHACDYPKLGYDTQAIYITCNMFNFPIAAGNFQYGKVRIMAKSQFLSGTCCNWYDHWNLPETVQPAIMHRARDSDGEYLADANGEQGGSGDGLDVYHLPDPIGNPSEFDQTSVSVGGYYTPPGAPQPGGPLLDTGDARLQFAVWQGGNLSSGQNSLCTSADTYAACAIFYELNVSGFPSASVVNNWAMQEENVAFYYPAVDENGNSDKIMVFTLSIGGPPGGGGPEAVYVVIPNSQTCTGCAIGLPQGEGGLATVPGALPPYANTGPPPNTRNRWGDYLGAAADPDGHGIWIAGENIDAPTQWAVSVGAFYKTYLPALKISPTSVNFSDTQSSKSWEQDITLTNGGNADLILQSIKLTGSSDYSVSSNTCKEGKASPSSGALEPNQSCVVTVRFKPSGSGQKTATLNICSNVRTPCLVPDAVNLSFNGPVISKVQPNNAPLVGGTVNITGAGLSGSFTFDFGGTPATGVTCWSATSCTMTAPAHAAGSVDVIAKDGSTSSSANPDDRFTYQAPAITKISPAVGPTTGGQEVELTGEGFYPLMIVKFGGATVTWENGGIQTTTVLCPSDTSCPVASPAGTGAVHVTATLSGVTSPETAANLYTYVIFPAVAGVTPAQGPVTGGIPVTVTGTNFSTAPGGTAFQFASLSPTNVSCASSTECMMTAPVRAANAGYLGGNVTATVNGRTSTGFATFSFGTPPSPIKPIKAPPCKGTDCQN
jgi:hypothetical protein